MEALEIASADVVHKLARGADQVMGVEIQAGLRCCRLGWNCMRRNQGEGRRTGVVGGQDGGIPWPWFISTAQSFPIASLSIASSTATPQSYRTQYPQQGSTLSHFFLRPLQVKQTWAAQDTLERPPSAAMIDRYLCRDICV